MQNNGRRAGRQDPWRIIGISANALGAALKRQNMHFFVPAVIGTRRLTVLENPNTFAVQVTSRMALEPDPT